jgi:hypothetical protein
VTGAGKRALYFGCIGQLGHFLHGSAADPRSLTPELDYPGFPWTIGDLDTGLLKRAGVADKPSGRVNWTCGGSPVLWLAFYWWDRSLDTRGACNSGFYVSGFKIGEAVEAFAFACEEWPAVVARQAHPLVLKGIS